MTLNPDKPSRMPVIMSALVYPGVGQFMQKRNFWGIVYALGFTVFFVISCVLLVRGITDSFYHGVPARDSIRVVLKPIGLCLLVWLAGIYDTWWAGHKAHRANVANAGDPPPLS